MPKNPLITTEISIEYEKGFYVGFEKTRKKIYNEEKFNDLLGKIGSIIDTRFLYHMMMGNHLFGDWEDCSNEEVLSKIANIGIVYGNMFAEQLVAFINSNSIMPVEAPYDVETKTKKVNGNKTSHFTGTNSSTNSSESNRYDVSEIAPITSAINTINTPSNKNKMNSDTGGKSSSEFTNSGGEENLYTENENLNKTYFENSIKMIEFYLEKGNIFAVMLDCMVDKCVYETNVIF